MAQMQMLLDQLQQANARNETLQTQVMDLNQRMLAADQTSQNLQATTTSMVEELARLRNESQNTSQAVYNQQAVGSPPGGYRDPLDVRNLGKHGAEGLSGR